MHMLKQGEAGAANGTSACPVAVTSFFQPVCNPGHHAQFYCDAAGRASKNDYTTLYSIGPECGQWTHLDRDGVVRACLPRWAKKENRS